jgi:hypothetical protein
MTNKMIYEKIENEMKKKQDEELDDLMKIKFIEKNKEE